MTLSWLLLYKVFKFHASNNMCHKFIFFYDQIISHCKDSHILFIHSWVAVSTFRAVMSCVGCLSVCVCMVPGVELRPHTVQAVPLPLSHISATICHYWNINYGLKKGRVSWGKNLYDLTKSLVPPLHISDEDEEHFTSPETASQPIAPNPGTAWVLVSFPTLGWSVSSLT